MSSLWTRLEPLLDRVEKPARYIGCEDGGQVRAHDPAAVAWLLAYPDAALGTDPRCGRVCRTYQWIERDGALVEPLPPHGGRRQPRRPSVTVPPARRGACIMRRDLFHARPRRIPVGARQLHGNDRGG